MQEFRLLDNSGRYVLCKAFGRHAGNTLIANGAQVILYFAMAKIGLSNQPGSLWLFDEAHAVELAHGRSIPVAKHQMELRA